MPHMDLHDECSLNLNSYQNSPFACNAPPLYSATSIPKDHTADDHHVASDHNGQPKVDEAESGVDSSLKFEETLVAQIHGVESPQEVEDVQIQEVIQIVSLSESSNADANLSGEIEADIQVHADNGIMGMTESFNNGIHIEADSSQKADDILIHEENGAVSINFSDTDSNSSPEETIEAESSQMADDLQNHKENGIVKAPEFSTTEANPWSEIEVEFSPEVADILPNGHCVDGEEKVDEMVNKAVPVGLIGESQNISMGAARSELDHLNDLAEDVKGECKSWAVLNEENSKGTQVTISQNGENYSVKGEELESSENEVSLLESSEGNNVETEQYSPLDNSDCVKGSISISTENGLRTSMDQDDLDDKDIVANGTCFHEHTEASSGSVDCDIAMVETHKLSPTMLIKDPKVESNEITVNELEVSHVLKLEENSETAANLKVDKYDKVDVLECIASENGDNLPIALDDDFVAGSELILEEIEHVQNIETMVSAIVIGSIVIDTKESSSIHFLNDQVLRSDLEVKDCTMSENVASAGDDIQRDKEDHENQDIDLISDSNSETQCEKGYLEKDYESSFPRLDARPTKFKCSVVNKSKWWCPKVQIVSESPNGVNKSSMIQQSSVVATDSELHENECNSSTTANNKSGCDNEITSSVEGGSRSIPGEDCNLSKTTVLKGSVVNNEWDLNPMSDIAFETDGKSTKEVTEIVHEGCQNEPSPISPEGSVDAVEGKNVGAEAGTRPFNFLIRVPRFDEENIREQIKCAQTEVDRKTNDREAIRVLIQTIRAAWKVLGDNIKVAVSEERAARDLLKSKRQEIDSVQSVITKVKNAMSVEDIDVRTRNIQHMIEHETVPLKEEKQLIREIKQLKQLRDQLSATMGKQEELQQALSQKDEIEERLKLLRTEMNSLRDNVLKAELVTKSAKQKYNDEIVKLDELQSQFKAADKTRQEAYANLQSLKKQLYEKNKYCWKYRDDTKEANGIASSRDVGRLQSFCINQVERMMELWNTNAEFRDEYIKSNMTSTLRRLKTLDGRSLGPNEEPHVLINNTVKERPARDDSLSTMQEPEKVIPKRDHDKPVTKVVETKNQTKKSKKPDTVVALVNVHSEKEVEEALQAEENKRRREEEKLAAKAEELRAIELKEQRKLEEKAKAKEALERKKRNAEKANARAVIRAQKEAEKRDKEREKRAKKKETKMQAGVGLEERECAMLTESENQGEQRTVVATNGPRNVSSRYTKQQSKMKSIRPPFHNHRGVKRRMQPWMWVLLIIVLSLLTVFVLFSTRSSSWLGF